VAALPADENWTFEIKFDGYRCIAVKRGREVTVFSRQRKVLNRRFPSVVQALVSLGSDFVLDGELVALDSQGRPSFQILQNNLTPTISGFIGRSVLEKAAQIRGSTTLHTFPARYLLMPPRAIDIRSGWPPCARSINK
jgi:hypothetical protein